jgi:cytochrome c553
MGGHADDCRDIGVRADASVLAGQWAGHMRAQFADCRAGNRSQPRKMEASMKPLSEEGVESLLNFCASLQ